MARGDQLGRQWKLIQALSAYRTGKSAAELARELGCHPRTVYRDLEALQVAGFPLYTDRVEGRSLWSFLDTVKHQIPIPLDLTELMALYFSRDMLKVLRNTVFYDSLETLFQKIKATLPPEYINYLQRIEKSLKVGFGSYKEYGQQTEVLNTINQAVLNGKYIEMIYFTMSRKKETRRKVAPYKIWFFDGTFYLIGHCLLRDAVRLFAIDRIKSLHLTEESFQVPEDFSTEDFMRSSFGTFVGNPTTVKIHFESEIAGYIQEKIWHENQEIKPQADGSVIFTATVAGTDEIKFWILSWGSKATVLEPAVLRDEIQSEAEAMYAKYINALHMKSSDVSKIQTSHG